MTMLDTFNSDAFNVVSLSTALDKYPYAPNWLGRLGIFQKKGISTKTAVIEDRQGILSLVPVSARGTSVNTENRPNRTAQPFLVPHLSLTSSIMAEDVQDVRAFGTENVVETLAQKVMDVMNGLRMDIEATKEYWRYGAIKGLVLDETGSTIYNYFTKFGTTEQTVDFVLATTTTNIKAACQAVVDAMHDALGGTMITGIVGLAGKDWFDDFIGHTEVKAAYDRWNDGQMLRTLQSGPEFFTGPDGQAGFGFAGIEFVRSRASLGGTPWIADDECRFFPIGVPDLFQEVNAPASYDETVNTTGIEYYAKQERMRFDIGIDVQVESNPLIIATRPRCLIKGTQS